MKKQVVETRVKDILISETCQCDECKKEFTGNYFNVHVMHHEWGNDSVDSCETKQFCSKDCLTKEFLQYINEEGKYGEHDYDFTVEERTTKGYKEGNHDVMIDS